MKRILTFIVILAIALTCALTASAEGGQVTYDGIAGQFIFAPGSDHSLTDLFPNFKGVMPGDTLTQRITVRNDASHDVKVKIYIRALGAHEDSVEFLSQLSLRVQKSEDNDMAYMFDAAANETAQLTDWVYLGMLYSGGEVNLDVILTVPVELGNEFQNAIGYLDWEFRVEEFPVEPDDPDPTSDNSNVLVWMTLLFASLILFVIFWKKREREAEQTA